jgi:hypothetical protein
MSPAGLGPVNDCAGETSSKCKRQTHPLVREDVTKRLCPQVFSWKKMLVASLKGLVAKTN